MAGRSAFARSRFLRICVRSSFIIWYDWGGWWNQLRLLSGHKFSYCAVVSKNGFCCTHLFLQEFFFSHTNIFLPVLFSPFHLFLFFFYFSFLFLSSFSFTSLKQSKNISVMVCIVVSLRVFHKALKEKIPVFPIKSTLHHHQCVSCLTPRREYNWLRWSKSMK